MKENKYNMVLIFWGVSRQSTIWWNNNKTSRAIHDVGLYYKTKPKIIMITERYNVYQRNYYHDQLGRNIQVKFYCDTLKTHSISNNYGYIWLSLWYGNEVINIFWIKK